MNHRIFCICCLLLGNMLHAQVVVSIKNTSGIPIKGVVVEIPWKMLASKFKIADTATLGVVEKNGGTFLPFQFETKGTAGIQNVLVQVDLPPNGTRDIVLKKGKPSNIQYKTFARFVPERSDDFAWENDKIAFRTYGKALEGTKGDAYGFDVWAKRTDALIINKRYLEKNYHVDNGDGLDYYHVGHTLGAGNCAPFVNDSIYYSGNYHRYRILDNGPIRTSFVLEYDEWNVNGTKMTAEKLISIDAGSQMNRIEASYHFTGLDTLPVVIGIIKRPEPGLINMNEHDGLVAYWEPEHGKDGITAIGVWLPQGKVLNTITQEQLLLHTSISSKNPLVYYTGAAWNKAGEITTAEAWNNYLKHFIAMKRNPVKITIQ